MRARPPATRPSCIAAAVASSDRFAGVRDGMVIGVFLYSEYVTDENAAIKL